VVRRWLIVASALVACGDNLQAGDDHDGGAVPAVAVIAPATVKLVEGETTSFVVTLDQDPERAVTVDIAARDAGVAAVSTQSITLTSASFASGEPVTLAGVEDDDDLVNDATEIELSIDGTVVAHVTATVFDNDVQQIIVDQTALTIVESSSATFSVRLARQPAASITMDVRSNADSTASPDPTQLTFAPAVYDVPQLVTVHAIADNDVVDNTTAITLSNVPTAMIETVAVDVTDDDTQALVLGATAVTVAEGGTSTFTVALAFDPASSVLVQLQSSDPSAVTTALPGVAFDTSNYNIPQSVTVRGVEDADGIDDVASIMLTGPASSAVMVRTTDNDIILAGGQLYVSEGRTGTLAVGLAADPGPNGLSVDVALVTGDLQLLQDTLAFTSANYAVTQYVMFYAPRDASSTANRSAVVRVSSPGHGARDVSVTIWNTEPSPLGVSVTHESGLVEAVGWMQLELGIDTRLPGDGRIVITLPAGYDASAASVLASSLDGTLSVVATTSTITLTRAGGTTLYSPARPTVRLANIRNPGVSGPYAIAVATQTAGGSAIDTGTGNIGIAHRWLASASVAFATLDPAATGNVTVTFTTQTTWPADGKLEIYFPLGFDVAAVTAVGQSGIDGTMSASMSAAYRVRLARAGGTALAAGSTVSLTIGNITNPATAQATTSFELVTEGANGGWIEIGFPEGVVIGCPATMTKTAQHGYNAPRGGTAWQCPLCSEPYIPMFDSSDWLVLDDFRFSVPAGASIAGIRFDVTHKSRGWPVVDAAMRAVKATTIGTADRSSATSWASFETVSYGGPSDLWGQTWSATDISSTTFGIALAARAVTSGMAGEVLAGPVRATVYLSCP
jgi:hypothetical protein